MAKKAPNDTAITTLVRTLL